MTKESKERPICTARTKSCRNCGYRYVKGDKTWKCPECGADRRCRNYAKEGWNVCRVHGAGAGRPPTRTRYTLPTQITEAWNRIFGDPELLSLSASIAMLDARTDQLFQRMGEFDPSGSYKIIMSAINEIEDVIHYLVNNRGRPPQNPLYTIDDLNKGMGLLKMALEPVIVEAQLWQEIKDNFELMTRMNNVERRYLLEAEANIPMAQVIEAMARTMQRAMKYIREPKDRAAFAREMRGDMPDIG